MITLTLLMRTPVRMLLLSPEMANSPRIVRLSKTASLMIHFITAGTRSVLLHANAQVLELLSYELKKYVRIQCWFCDLVHFR